MYKKLWKKLNREYTVAHTAAIYLTVMTLGWMLWTPCRLDWSDDHTF